MKDIHNEEWRGNKYLILNKREWQLEREQKGLGFSWTDEELNNSEDKGYIGTKNGVDCYIAKKLESLKK